MKIEKLKDFYHLINKTKRYKEKIVNLYLKNKKTNSKLVAFLHGALDSLEKVQTIDNKSLFFMNDNKKIYLDIGYEIGELKKDICFLEQGEAKFYRYMEEQHSEFLKEVKAGELFLKTKKFNNFITDRDGTINNYCARYTSSIQSVYNSIFITNFALNNTKNSVILTSAQLEKVGLVDVSINPKNIFVYAGSKGREYFDKKGRRRQLSIEKDKQEKLNELNRILLKLTKNEKYERFSVIGSGLQFKFGQTTIARQNINNSVAEDESNDFLSIVTAIVDGVDPAKKYFRIEDTGLDIEIILTIDVDQKNNLKKDFDKGDGLEFLNKELNLKMKEGPNLICGDTRSDIPMLKTALKCTKDTWGIFVTKNENLKKEARSVCRNILFLSEPDILVAVLNNIRKGRVK